MKQFKRAQAIMLPTKESSHLVIRNNILVYYLNKNNDFVKVYNPQHLYIISSSEIKEGDWSYNIVSKNIFQADNNFIKLINQDEIITNKKIIATTDTSLTEDKRTYISGLMDNPNILPQPSQQFITKYIESYNKGEIITDVLVEYEKIDVDPDLKQNLRYYPDNFKLKLKINPKDNNITIKRLKNSWNREEVKQLMIDSYKISASNNLDQTIKWIEENL